MMRWRCLRFASVGVATTLIGAAACAGCNVDTTRQVPAASKQAPAPEPERTVQQSHAPTAHADRAAHPATQHVATDDALPRELECLARYYAGRAALRDSQWVLELPDGTALPFDDGRDKTFEQRLREPDLEDMFHDAYPTGAPAAQEKRPDYDPGRYRVRALFEAAYGATAEAVRARLRPVRVLGREVRFHERAADALRRVATTLDALATEGAGRGKKPAILEGVSGTFHWREVAGTERLSAHAFGIAIDLHAPAADYWRWSEGGVIRHPVPQAVVDAFEREGFIWGGRWAHFDTMHFEYRPELLDASCRD